MNSELIVKLETLIERNEAKLKEYQEEYAELTDLGHVQTKKDLARIKEIRKEVGDLPADNKEMKQDVIDLKEVNQKIADLTAVIQKNEEPARRYAEEWKEAALAEEAELERELEEKWAKELRTLDAPASERPEQEENAEQEELNNSNKKTSKKALISIAALCAALGIVTGIVIGKSGNKKVKDYDTPTKIEEVDNTKVENLEFTDINDEEQVAKRAYDIKMEIDKQVPNNDYSIEEIENMLRWFNGGVVEEVKNEEALFASGRVEYLMNKENQEEVEKPFDVSKFFLDGTEGQELAKKIYDSKSALMETKGNEEAFQKNADEFTKLLVNSWALNGTNNETSAYVLETSGMKFLIDTYFVNTYAYINVPVRVVVNGAEFELDKVIEDANKATCPAEVTADNGEVFTTNVNKLTSDMIGMVSEAAINKQNANSLTLTK